MARHQKVDPATAARRAEEAKVRRGATPSQAPRTIEGKAKYQRHETGLDALRRTAKIDARQVAAGERYGRLWRHAQIEGEGAMKSSMAALISEGIRGTAGGDANPADAIQAQAAAVLQARRDLHAAQMALGLDDGLVGACDVICGKQWTVGQITGVRREQEAIVVILETGLNMLAKHFAAPSSRGQSGPKSIPA